MSIVRRFYIWKYGTDKSTVTVTPKCQDSDDQYYLFEIVNDERCTW